MCWQNSDNGLILNIKVKANAKQTEVVGIKDERLCIKIASPPIDGKANTELIKLLAKKFKIPQSAFIIKSGGNSSLKRLLIKNTAVREMTDVIAAIERWIRAQPKK